MPPPCAPRSTWATGPARPAPSTTWGSCAGYRGLPGAARDLQQALGLYRDLGDRLGQASVLTCLGNVRASTDDYRDAARDLQEALDLYRGLGNRLGQANALTALGELRQLTWTIRVRPGTCRRRWTSTAASATSPARPAPSPHWGSCGG